MLYGAYGANLNMANMEVRCPQAKPILGFTLVGFRLVFNGVADIIKHKGAKVPIGLWKITDKCEKALDKFEGFPYLYKKLNLNLKCLDLKVRKLCFMLCVEKVLVFHQLIITTRLLKDMKILFLIKITCVGQFVRLRKTKNLNLI